MPLHLPGHNFAGPGTDVKKQLREGKHPVNYLDWASLLHDIDYGSDKSTKEADSDFIQRLEQDDTITGTAVKHLFKGKQFVDKYIYDTDKVFRPDYMPPTKRQKTYHHTDTDINLDFSPADDPQFGNLKEYEDGPPAHKYKKKTNHLQDILEGKGYKHAENVPLPDDDFEMSDEPNTGSAPDATRDEPDGKRQRRNAPESSTANGGGRNVNPNTGISSAADPYAGHQDKLQYIDIEFWENKLDGTLAEGEIIWFPAQQYPWDMFTSKGNEAKWKYLLQNEQYATISKYPQNKIGKFSHWAIIEEPEITISKIQFHNDEVQTSAGAPNTKFTAMQAGYLWQFSVPGNQPYCLINKQAGGVLGHGDHVEDQLYRKMEKADNNTIYKKGLDGLEYARRNLDVPNGYRLLTDEDVFDHTEVNGFWHNAGPLFNQLQGPAQDANFKTHTNWFRNEDQMRLNYTWGDVYNHAAMIFGGINRAIPGKTMGHERYCTLTQPFQPAIKDIANFKSIYAGDIVKIHCNTGVKGKPMSAGIEPMEAIRFKQAYDWDRLQTDAATPEADVHSRCWYTATIQPVWPRKNLPDVKRCLYPDLHMQLAAQQCNEKSNIQFITIAPQ